ncbi:MAG: oligosaccharide flippase family protein [Solirubrobacteraceae bacterium]
MVDLTDSTKRDAAIEPVSDRRVFALSAGAMMALSVLAGVINYASSIVFGRILSPSSFGELTALLSLVVIVTIPTSAAQMIVAERIASLRAQTRLAQVRYLLRYGAAYVLLLSVLVGVAYVALIPVVVRVLHLAHLGPAIATLPLLAAGFFLSFAQGVLQGLERFVALGLTVIIAAVSRLVIGVPWALLGGGPGGALGGQALGSVVGIGLAWWVVRDLHLPRGTGAARAGVRRRPDSRAFWAVAGYVAFALLSNLDVILAKSFLEPAASGRYAALVTIERIILFLPGAIAIVTVPSAARARIQSDGHTTVLRTATFAILACVLIIVVPAALAPRLLLTIMFGSRYASAAAGVLPITIAGGGFALLDLLIAYTVSIGHRRATYLLLAMVPIQAAAIFVWHGSAPQIASVQAGVVIVALIINEALCFPLLRAHRHVA